MNMIASSNVLSPPSLKALDAYWRAANYLSVGQIYLYDNPLLKKPLSLAHIKPRLLGHWGTTPGLNFIYVHLNRFAASSSPMACRGVHAVSPGSPPRRTARCTCPAMVSCSGSQWPPAT